MPKVTITNTKGLVQSKGSGLEVNSNTKINTRLSRQTPVILLKWNYITCAAPVVGNIGESADGVLADGDSFGMMVPGANGELGWLVGNSVGAFTAAGSSPTVIGTIPATDTAATEAGLNLQMDATTAGNVGLQLSCGSNFGANANKFIVGTHSGHIDVTFFCNDVTDYDCVVIGFRSAEAFQTGFNTVAATGASGDLLYTDVVAYGVQGVTSNNGDLAISTDLNGSGTSTFTDSTDNTTDAENTRIRVNLSAAGVVTYQFVTNAVAGAGTLAAPTATAAFTFDSGDTLIPYIAILGTNEDDSILLKDIEISRSPGILYQN